MTGRLKKQDTILMAIDFQEKLMPAMEGKERLEDAAARLIRGCRVMGVPILVTQQYTKGLGATAPALHTALTDAFGTVGGAAYTPIEKTTFSALGAPECLDALKKAEKKTVIICGIEAHVCVQQTVIDLLDLGYTVFVASDCVSSRKPEDMRMAKSRMRAEGAIYTTMEAVLFELCGGAKEPGFKEISSIVK